MNVINAAKRFTTILPTSVTAC